MSLNGKKQITWGFLCQKSHSKSPGTWFCFVLTLPVSPQSLYSSLVLPGRYMAIIHPLQQRMSSTETKVVVAVIWVLALLLAFPQYYYSNTDQLPGRVVCYIDWPEYTICDFKKMWVPIKFIHMSFDFCLLRSLLKVPPPPKQTGTI